MAKVPDYDSALMKKKSNVSSLAGSMFAKLKPAKKHESVSPLQTAINSSTDYLFDIQKDDGHWKFDLEADATIPSEYIFLQRFLGKSNRGRDLAMCKYLLSRQNDNGSWPLYHGGPGNVSAT